MTLQEWLNQNWPALKARMAVPVKAAKSDGTCQYRVNQIATDMSPKNCCFIGALMAPEDYNPQWDIHGQPAPIVMARIEPTLAETDLRNLRGLQAIHDSYPPSRWPEVFKDWLQNCKLTVPE